MKNVLIVEDEVLLGFEIESILEAAGYKTLGPAPSVSSALAIIDIEPLDAALLDINLGSEKSFPVADALTAKGIPFVIVTGYSADHIPPRHRQRPLITKPYRPESIVEALVSLDGEQRVGIS